MHFAERMRGLTLPVQKSTLVISIIIELLPRDSGKITSQFLYSSQLNTSLPLFARIGICSDSLHRFGIEVVAKIAELR